MEDWSHQTEQQLEVSIKPEKMAEAFEELYESRQKDLALRRCCGFHHVLAWIINAKAAPRGLEKEDFFRLLSKYGSSLKKAELYECREEELLSPAITKLFFEYEKWREKYEKEQQSKKRARKRNS